MEGSHEDPVTENKKLQARVFALEELRTSTEVNQVMDPLGIEQSRWLILMLLILTMLDPSVQDIEQELIYALIQSILGMMNNKMMKKNDKKLLIK